MIKQFFQRWLGIQELSDNLAIARAHEEKQVLAALRGNLSKAIDDAMDELSGVDSFGDLDGLGAIVDDSTTVTNYESITAGRYPSKPIYPDDDPHDDDMWPAIPAPGTVIEPSLEDDPNELAEIEAALDAAEMISVADDPEVMQALQQTSLNTRVINRVVKGYER